MKHAYVNFFRSQRSKERFGRRKGFHFRHFAALVLAVLMILSSIPVGYAADTPRRAVITVMEGSVLVQAAGQATAVPARKGMELKSGDRIITGKDGSCTIRYDDGCTTHIGPNSRVDMTNLARQGADGSNTTILNSQRGTLWNNAKDVMARNSRFEVNTPSAVAAVRGTFFKSIVLPNGDTLFIVLGGGLYISPAGSDEDDGVTPPSDSDGGVFVGGGQQLGVSSGEELPDSAVPLDYDNVDDITLLYLAQDNPDIFVELIERAAAQGETEFLERVNQLVEDNENMQQNLGDKLETVRDTLKDGTSQPPASSGGGGSSTDPDPENIFAGGTGTEQDPFQIATVNHLNNVKHYLGEEHADKYFELTADIDLGGYSSGEGWESIGYDDGGDVPLPFTGTFIGNGKTINNLTINRPEEFNIGLFGVTSGAEIANVNLVDVNINGGENVGSLVGDSNESTITGCSATGSITGEAWLGGLVGVNSGSITESYSSGSVVGTSNVGGLAGYNCGCIVNTYATASVEGTSCIGGLVGYNDCDGEVSCSYAAGSVTGDIEADYVGGLVGRYVAGYVQDSYYDMDTSGKTDDDRGQPLDTWSMTQQETFDDLAYVWDFQPWDFAWIWAIEEGQSYPYLQWQTDNIPYVREWTAVGDPGFSAGAADYINLKVGYDETESLVPYVAYSSDDQVLVQKYISGENWDDPYLTENAYGVSDISLYADDYYGPYVAYNDSSNVYVKVRDWMYGWQSIGSDLAIDATDISLHVKWDTPYLAYSNSDEVTVMAYEEYEGCWYPVGNDPVFEGTATDISLYVEGYEVCTPYLAYSKSDEVTVCNFVYDDPCGDVWAPVGGGPVFAGAATDVSLYVGPADYDSTSTPYVAYREQTTGEISLKEFDGNDWSDVIDDEDGLPISASTDDSIAFSGVRLSYMPEYEIDSPMLFVAYKDKYDDNKVKVMGYVPYFTEEYGFQGFRWVNIGGVVSTGEADSISLCAYLGWDDYGDGHVICKLFVAFKDYENNCGVTVKEYQLDFPQLMPY